MRNPKPRGRQFTTRGSQLFVDGKQVKGFRDPDSGTRLTEGRDVVVKRMEDGSWSVHPGPKSKIAFNNIEMLF